ncbi:MAG: restriction endonuclease subunit S [Gallionella sp.]|nr:restriction endonuclease subunit S [Gallionella sp.]
MFDPKPLGDAVASHIGGGTPSRQVQSFWGGGIPWASVKDFTDEADEISSTQETISQKGLSASASNLIPAGTPLVCTRMAVGRAAMPTVSMTINQDVKALYPAAGVAPAYLILLLQYMQRIAEAQSVGSTVKGIRIQDYLAIPVPQAPTVEQPKIAEVLASLNKAIHQTGAIVEKLKQVKQGLLHDLLTRGVDANGELRPSYEQAPHLYQDSPLGWIPLAWEVGTIESFLDNVIDYRGKTPAKTDSGIPLITAKNVRLGYIDEEPREFIAEASFDRWMTRGIPQKGDVLFTMEAPLGNVAQIATESRLAFAQRIIILQTGTKLLSTYLKYLLLSEKFRRQLFSFGSGSTVEGIQQATFRKLIVTIPSSRVEQTLIAERLLAETEKILVEEKALSKMLNLKSGLMDDLLTGRVRVTPLLKDTAP